MARAKRKSNEISVPQRRLPTEQRRLEIARVAGDLFAAHGFSVSTRTISDALGITQAALYKHFSSKEEIIEEVFRIRYLDQKESNFSNILDTSTDKLSRRLTRAYVSFFEEITETSLKLFQRASYDDLEIAKRYTPHLNDRIIWPILEHLRVEAKLPDLVQRPASNQERELILMLHSTIIFLAIRKFVYHIEFKAPEADIIELHVNVWLSGALKNIRTMQ